MAIENNPTAWQHELLQLFSAAFPLYLVKEDALGSNVKITFSKSRFEAKIEITITSPEATI